MSHSLYDNFAARFAASSLQSLVESFNGQVGCRGWASARAFHDKALIDELIRRGVDVSAVSDGKNISFAHPVALHDNRLEQID